MTRETIYKGASAAARICAISPTGTIILYVLLAFCARGVAGHWPRYYEYLAVFQSPAFRIVGGAFVLWGVASLLLAPLTWIALTWITRPGVRIAVRQAAVFFGTWLIFLFLASADFNGFSSFLID